MDIKLILINDFVGTTHKEKQLLQKKDGFLKNVYLKKLYLIIACCGTTNNVKPLTKQNQLPETSFYALP